MEKSEMMKKFEAETGKQSAIVKFMSGGQALERKSYPKLGPYDYNMEYLAWLEAKAAAYDRLVSKTIMSDAELDAPLAQKILREMCEKAEAYDRLIEKLSLWGKHLKSASMAQNSLDFVYCAQQVMDEITLTMPDKWEERTNQEETFDYNLEQLGLK